MRIAGGLSPLAMLAATIFTANHYLLDVAMGALVALAGLAIVAWLMRRWATPGPGGTGQRGPLIDRDAARADAPRLPDGAPVESLASVRANGAEPPEENTSERVHIG